MWANRHHVRLDMPRTRGADVAATQHDDAHRPASMERVWTKRAPATQPVPRVDT